MNKQNLLRKFTMPAAFMILGGCATTMDTSSLPSNMTFGPPNGNGYSELESITFKSTLPPNTPDFTTKMQQCVEESVDFARVVVKDDSKSFVGAFSGNFYKQGNRDVIEGGQVITQVDKENQFVKAQGQSLYKPGTYVKYDLIAKLSGDKEYITRFHSIMLLLDSTGLVENTGYFKASNNPYQHPETIYAKAKSISDHIDRCMTE